MPTATLKLILQDGEVAVATFKAGSGVEVWKRGEYCGTVSQDEVRSFAKYNHPENLISMVEALLGEPMLLAHSRASLLDVLQSWFQASYLVPGT
jgi:hypothetical protein